MCLLLGLTLTHGRMEWVNTGNVAGGVCLYRDEASIPSDDFTRNTRIAGTNRHCAPLVVPLQVINSIYYPSEVRRGKYWGLGVFLLQYFPLVSI